MPVGGDETALEPPPPHATNVRAQNKHVVMDFICTLLFAFFIKFGK
jgi:hypothetical protein